MARPLSPRTALAKAIGDERIIWSSEPLNEKGIRSRHTDANDRVSAGRVLRRLRLLGLEIRPVRRG